jgi:gamma-D-glutamyl-L-lysine dipeptidyl-peptidase
MSRPLSDRVCSVEIAPVRAEPRDDSEQVTQLLRGEPVSVDEEREGWIRIRTTYDYPGWVRAEALAGDPIREARGYLGTPYEWGGMTEAGIDCSGLVHMAYRRAGRLVPRDADQQEDAGTPLGDAEASPGDVVTYGEGELATHIAFWLGGGRILHATGRDSVNGVVEEAEPPDLAATRRGFFRL